jgi:hypothetical protein
LDQATRHRREMANPTLDRFVDTLMPNDPSQN